MSLLPVEKRERFLPTDADARLVSLVIKPALQVRGDFHQVLLRKDSIRMTITSAKHEIAFAGDVPSGTRLFPVLNLLIQPVADRQPQRGVEKDTLVPLTVFGDTGQDTAAGSSSEEGFGHHVIVGVGSDDEVHPPIEHERVEFGSIDFRRNPLLESLFVIFCCLSHRGKPLDLVCRRTGLAEIENGLFRGQFSHLSEKGVPRLPPTLLLSVDAAEVGPLLAKIVRTRTHPDDTELNNIAVRIRLVAQESVKLSDDLMHGSFGCGLLDGIPRLNDGGNPPWAVHLSADQSDRFGDQSRRAFVLNTGSTVIELSATETETQLGAVLGHGRISVVELEELCLETFVSTEQVREDLSPTLIHEDGNSRDVVDPRHAAQDQGALGVDDVPDIVEIRVDTSCSDRSRFLCICHFGRGIDLEDCRSLFFGFFHTDN